MSIYKERKRQLYAEAAEAIKNVPGIESVRVLKRNELLAALDMDKSTLDRMEARGEGPPKTQLSPKRIGYRIADVTRWLDGRRKCYRTKETLLEWLDQQPAANPDARLRHGRAIDITEESST